MRSIGFHLFVRAFRGDAESARQLMRNFQPPVFLQQLLAKRRNVEVQSVVAKYTRNLDDLVFEFATESDLAMFEVLCVTHRHGIPFQRMWNKPFRARVMEDVRTDVHKYSF